MLRLASRKAGQCVGGFQFRQPQTGAEFLAWDFEQLVKEIIKHREKNPRFNLTTDPVAVRNEVDLSNATRMQHIRGADIYIVNDPGPAPPSFPVAPRSRSWRSAVGGVKKVAAGVGVLLDWLGSGATPVNADIANGRAAICETCPKNQPGDIASIFTEPVAEKIRTQLAIRRDLNLSTPSDEKLKVCQACMCSLPLKVWVPIMHISDHLTDAVNSELWEQCWIKSERK